MTARPTIKKCKSVSKGAWLPQRDLLF